MPPRSFLRDEILLDMARTPIKSVDRLERVRGLPRPVESQHGQTIVEETLAALSLPQASLPAAVRDVEPLPSDRFRSDALTSVAHAICAGQGIDPALVASRQDLAEFWQALKSGSPPDDHRIMRGWRREAVGQPLADIVLSSARYSMTWSEDALRIKRGA